VSAAVSVVCRNFAEFSVPSAWGWAGFSSLAALPLLWERLDAGRAILIHCSAGIHRTGMIAYALLRWRGHSEDVALAVIAKMRLHTRDGVQRKQLDWVNDTIPMKARGECRTANDSGSAVRRTTNTP
jgi:hypothetical protein